jgi:hypothetical protein
VAHRSHFVLIVSDEGNKVIQPLHQNEVHRRLPQQRGQERLRGHVAPAPAKTFLLVPKFSRYGHARGVDVRREEAQHDQVVLRQPEGVHKVSVL